MAIFYKKEHINKHVIPIKKRKNKLFLTSLSPSVLPILHEQLRV